jgi:gluconolactonase
MNKVLIMASMMLSVMTACAQMPSNDIVAEGETPVRVADSYSFTEGPAVDARGDVYFTDQPNNKIYRWDCESGEITLFTDQSGRSNGMYFDVQGNLIACADMDNQLWSFDIEGHSKILITDYRGKLMNGPNDVWISRDTLKMLVHGVAWSH